MTFDYSNASSSSDDYFDIDTTFNNNLFANLFTEKEVSLAAVTYIFNSGTNCHDR